MTAKQAKSLIKVKQGELVAPSEIAAIASNIKQHAGGNGVADLNAHDLQVVRI